MHEKTSFRNGYARLAKAQKSSVGVSYYSRWLNRPLGRVLASAAHVAGLTPNQVTGVSALCSLAGLFLLVLVRPSVGVGLAVGLLLILGFAFDSADGQLARLRGGGSRLGEWLDHVVDSGKTVLVHVGVLLVAWRFWAVPTWWLLVPLGYLFVAVVQFSGILLTQFLLPKQAGPAGRSPSPLRSLALLPADYGVLCLAFLTAGVPFVFVPLYTALGVATALITVAMVAQWVRRLSAA